MSSTLERRLEPQFQDFVGQPEGDDPASHREDVGIVVRARQASRIQIVAQGRAGARDFVRGDLLTLAAAAQHDTAVGATFDDRPGNSHANRRVVDRLFAVGSVIVDSVTESLQRLLQLLFE